jgi:stalled ribosome rescue protein Dom34
LALFPGLYECIVNHALEDLLSKAREDQVEVSLATMDEGENHIMLAQYMAGMIAQSLKKIKGKNKILNQIHICNSIIKQLSEKSLQIEYGNETITDAAKRHMEVRNPLIQAKPRPDTHLSFGCQI